MKCSKCAAEKETKSDRIPKGWKRRAEEVWCHKCWAKSYVLRAVTFPVVGPMNVEWTELRAALKAAWAQSTSLANWTVATLARNDVVRTPEMGDKCPRMKPLYLYPLARAAFPSLPSASLNAIIRTAEAKYFATRIETIWRHASALPTYRYPTPFPIPAQSWRVRWLSETERVPILRIQLADKHMELRLRGGSEFRRQLAAFSQLVSGDAIACEAAVYQVKVSGNDDHNGLANRSPGSGAKQFTRVMVKLVAWLPRHAPIQREEKTMTLAAAKDCFWVAIVEGRAPWQVNADHVRRWVVEHRKYLERIANDRKLEVRDAKKNRSQMNDAVAIRCKKQNDRLNSFCHMATAQVVSFAKRQSVTRIEFDDGCREYLPSFPWFKLAELLAQKCSAEGIELSVAKSPNGNIEEKVAESRAPQ